MSKYVTRQHYYGRRRWDGHDPFEYLQAVNIRQVDVEKDHVRILVANDLYTLLACESGGDLVGVGQHQLQRILGLGIVVDE